MPDDTMVASWREKIARSLSVIRSNSVMLISREECFSAISRITRPRARSWSETACLLSASTWPRSGAPATSIALKR